MRLRPARLTLSCLALSVLALVACSSDDSPVGPAPVRDPVWSEVTNLIPSITLYGLWAPRADYIIGVGRGGQIWQWDGQQWAQRVTAYSHDLYAIDGSTTGKLFAVGASGTVLEQVNGSFVRRDPIVGDDLHDVWRSPSEQFVAVGDYGSIIRGSSVWTADSPETRKALLSVWGSNDDDVFAVGVDGVILHYDGSAWRSMLSPTTELLSSVSGRDGNDVYAAGAAGTILHYDGNTWTTLASGSGDLLQSICADCGPVAIGVNGSVVRMSDGAFTRERIAGDPWLYAGARAGEDIWAVGANALFRHDGVAWKSETHGTIPVLRAMASLPTGLVALGDNGIVMLGGPQHWRVEDAGAVRRLNAVWISPAGDMYAAGTNRIFRRAGDGWVIENSDAVEYYDIGGNADHIFAVGKNGAIRERHAGTWSTVTLGSPQDLQDLHAIRMTDSEGYIAGNAGYILYYDGAHNTWSVGYTNSTATLWDITPVKTPQYIAIAVGTNGLCLGRSTGEGRENGWNPVQTPVSTTLYSLARGPGDYLYAVGDGGTVLRFNNDAWSLLPVPTTRTFRRAYARDGALFVCGGSDASGGILFRYGPPVP